MTILLLCSFQKQLWYYGAMLRHSKRSRECDQAEKSGLTNFLIISISELLRFRSSKKQKESIGTGRNIIWDDFT